jgi:hypothetical protein
LWRHKPKPTFTTTARAHAAHVHHHHIPSFCRPSTRIPFHHLLLSIFLPLDTSPNHIRCINFHLSSTYSYSVHNHLLLSIFLPLDASPKHPLPLLPLPFALSIYLSAVGRKRKSKPSVAFPSFCRLLGPEKTQPRNPAGLLLHLVAKRSVYYHGRSTHILVEPLL